LEAVIRLDDHGPRATASIGGENSASGQGVHARNLSSRDRARIAGGATSRSESCSHATSR
jgi:hypothetical protein